VTDGIESALEQARAAAGAQDIRLGGGAATVRELAVKYRPLSSGRLAACCPAMTNQRSFRDSVPCRPQSSPYGLMNRVKEA